MDKDFFTDKDRQDFVQRLSLLPAETGTYCFAWALLDNHVHMLLMPTEQTMAHLMCRLPLVIKVADYCSIAAEDLSRPCRQLAFVRANALVCYPATRRCRTAGADVAARLGYSTSAVSQDAKRGHQIFTDDESLHVLPGKVDF